MTATATGARFTVDATALARNIGHLRSLVTGTFIAAVKANGYGHGLPLVARAAAAGGIDWLGVTTLEEADAVRRCGFEGRVLSWLNGPDADYAYAAAARIDVAVSDRGQLDQVLRARTYGAAIRIHLHCDCGMNRDGASPQEWGHLVRAAARAQHRGRVRVAGLMGQLGCADGKADPCNRKARRLFLQARAEARRVGIDPALCHVGGTAAVLNHSWVRAGSARLGAGLVGIDGTGDTGITPTATLTAPLTMTREVPVGAAVGYGHTWTATRPTRLGLVPLGYADGLPGAASGRAEVSIAGSRCAVVGRISMDQIVVDLNTTRAQAGDTVTIFGPGADGEPTAQDWAAWSGTLEHEILTGIGPRIERRVTTAVPR